MRRFDLLAFSGVIARMQRSRPQRRRTTLECAAFGITMLGLSAALHPIPRLTWNASASAPIGLYGVVLHAEIKRGDLVLAALPPAARTLAAERGYLPFDVPVVKHVAALTGDIVCTHDSIITIDSRTAAKRLAADTRGRPLPAWTGCRVLHGGQVFLLNAAPDSFDGRYFGPVERRAVLGKLVAIWTR